MTTGLFGTRESFVPLALAEIVGAELQVPYDRDMVKGAPDVEAEGGHLSEQEEAELYTYYGLDYSEADSDRIGDDLPIDTVDQEVGRARLRKFIVTEQQTVTVPVTRQQLRIQREPITDADIASVTGTADGPTLREEEYEIVLHAERAVVDKQTVPVERVRLDTDAVGGSGARTDERPR